MEYAIVYTDDYLAHHGVKGMKWGVRRYQNADGSLTAAGKMRYNVDELRKKAKQRSDARYEKNIAKYTKKYDRYNEMSKRNDLILNNIGRQGKSILDSTHHRLAKQTEKRYGKAKDFKRKKNNVYENMKTGKQITSAQMSLLKHKTIRDTQKKVAIGLAAFKAIDSAWQNREIISSAWKNRPIKADWEFVDFARLPAHG